MSLEHKIRKPSNLVYGLNDRPPTPTLMLLGLQHIFVMAIGLIIPVALMRTVNSPHSITSSLVSLSMIAAGLATILQAKRRGPMGSGYLLPEGPDPSFLSVSAAALNAGGLPLMFGMTAIAGMFEMLLSRIMYRIRFLFPPEVTGTIVAMVGISVIPLAVPNFLGKGGLDQTTTAADITVAFVTLGAIVGCNVWGKGRIKMYAVLLGMCSGYAAALALNLLPSDDIAYINSASFVAFPHMPEMGWAFDSAMLLPFMIAITCSTLKNIGDITTCQKINDADWRRLDWASVKGGIFVDGLASLVGGLIGGMGQASYSANVGLSLASGATSRLIAYSAGGIMILLAFFPKLAAVLTVIPRPILGAALVFAISFMILAGLQIIMSRMIDARKTFVVGISLIFGLSAFIPGLYTGLPAWIQPVFSSSLSLCTVTVIILNMILRIGISRQHSTSLNPVTDGSQAVMDFMEKAGGEWGARKDVMYKAAASVTEFLESARRLELAENDIMLTTRFDEFNVDVTMQYYGVLMDFPLSMPDPDQLLEEDGALDKLAGYMIRHYADSMSVSEINEPRFWDMAMQKWHHYPDLVHTAHEEGLVTIKLHFDH